MPNSPVIPAILIGGAGTRLWPLSRSNKPKQFLRLIGPNSLFQDTVLRFDSDAFASPWLLTNADTLQLAWQQLSELGRAAAGVVIEPAMRGTAAALAALAQVIALTEPEALILAAPADHVIGHAEAFREAVTRAVPLAAAGRIVTFGIKPTAPETGFGYIRGEAPLDVGDEAVGFSIAAGGFLEKPSREMAELFIRNGYFWNAGIFLFKASSLLAEFQRLAPETFAAAREAVELGVPKRQGATAVWHLDADAFTSAPADLSIDNAIMEITDRAAVVPCEDIDWSDVGSLSALWEMSRQHEDANVIHGDGLCFQTSGSLIYARGNRKVVASHLKDVMIVDTDDCLVVLPRERAQEVKAIVKSLQANGSPETSYTREAAFGWGRVKIIGEHDGMTTAEVELQPASAFGPRVATNEHETWVVTHGQMLATRNGEPISLEAGASLSVKRRDVITLQAATAGASCVAVLASRQRGSLAGFVVSEIAVAEPELEAPEPAAPRPVAHLSFQPPQRTRAATVGRG